MKTLAFCVSVGGIFNPVKLTKDLQSGENLQHKLGASEDFQLGEAFIRPSLNRIEMASHEHQVEPKVMKVLLMLCARQGHVVHREELLKSVWEQTGGDDYLLNRAVSELRKIFADRAQNPKYIETIRKTGYRLLANTKPLTSAALVSNHVSQMDNIQTTPSPSSDSESGHLESDDLLTKQDVVHEARASECLSNGNNQLSRILGLFYTYRFWAVASAIVVALALFKIFVLAPLTSKSKQFSIGNYQLYPVTSDIGREYEPALSPDGSRVAFVIDEQNGDSTVNVKMLRGQKFIKLSQGESSARSPKWMPDGQSIVYASLSSSALRFVGVSPMGGAQRILFVDNAASDFRGMNISPDGKWLAYSKRVAANAPQQIWILSFSDNTTRQLTFPEEGALGDIDPLFTPDGKSIVFVRGSNEVTKDLFLLDVNLSEKDLLLTKKEKTKRLTFDNRKINGVAWSPDGSRLIFTSTRSGLYRLWSIDRHGSEPEALNIGIETVQRPATTLGVNAIIFEDWKHRAKIVSIDVSNRGAANLEPMFMSTRWDSNPTISPDGTTMMFASDRGGPYGIWLTKLEDGDTWEWINLGDAFIDNPDWSPDGSRVIFDASPDGESQLYIIGKNESVPKPLLLGGSNNRSPSWSGDGKWVYFESNRTGKWRLYAWRVGSEEVRQLQVPEGRNPQESVDGQWIIYSLNAGDSIWRCRKDSCMGHNASDQTNTIEAEPLITVLQPQDATNWAPAKSGIYFILREKGELPKLAFYSYASGDIQSVNELSKSFIGWGMELAPDEARLVFSELLQPESDIRIARPKHTTSNSWR